VVVDRSVPIELLTQSIIPSNFKFYHKLVFFRVKCDVSCYSLTNAPRFHWIDRLFVTLRLLFYFLIKILLCPHSDRLVEAELESTIEVSL